MWKVRSRPTESCPIGDPSGMNWEEQTWEYVSALSGGAGESCSITIVVNLPAGDQPMDMLAEALKQAHDDLRSDSKS